MKMEPQENGCKDNTHLHMAGVVGGGGGAAIKLRLNGKRLQCGKCDIFINDALNWFSIGWPL